MPTDKELMQRLLFNLEHTLPFIEDFGNKEDVSRQHKLIADIYARLAQPEPEPVAYLDAVDERTVYAAPEREWQGLTDEEIRESLRWSYGNFARAIEAKLKEKNNANR